MARKKTGGIWTVIIAALVTFIAGIVLLSWFGDRLPEQVQRRLAGKGGMKEVTLYFTGEDGLSLSPEKHEIRKGSPEAEARETLAALIKGPKHKDFANPLPEGTKLLSVKIDDNTATANFSAEIIKNHSGGTSGELQTIYSIVNSLALDSEEIDRVQILVNGKREKTIAGHIDISHPLGPDRKIVSRK